MIASFFSYNTIRTISYRYQVERKEYINVLEKSASILFTREHFAMYYFCSDSKLEIFKTGLRLI